MYDEWRTLLPTLPGETPWRKRLPFPAAGDDWITRKKDAKTGTRYPGRHRLSHLHRGVADGRFPSPLRLRNPGARDPGSFGRIIRFRAGQNGRFLGFQAAPQALERGEHA